MLSDREWKVLHEVERQFQAEDPAFWRSFVERERHLEHNDHRLARIAIVVATALSVIMLLTGATTGALALAVVAGLMWAVLRWWDEPAGGVGPRA